MRQRGFTYLTVLFIVAFMGLALALAGEVWQTGVAREREVQLLYAGNQYRRAIERYYLGGLNQYPRSLEDLLRDPRKPNTERYLRKLYPDPLTAKGEWSIVKGPDGGIMGVYSQSEDKPIKVAGFPLVNRDFEGATKYSDWKFVYSPQAQQAPVPAQGGVPGAPPPQQQPSGGMPITGVPPSGGMPMTGIPQR